MPSRFFRCLSLLAAATFLTACTTLPRDTSFTAEVAEVNRLAYSTPVLHTITGMYR